MKMAVTHPGKIGDALYSLPAIRTLYNIDRSVQFDFWTSQYCAPLKTLFEAQSCVDNFYVSDAYVAVHDRMGVQPWRIPVEGDYDGIYHLGFKAPPDCALHEYIAKESGIQLDTAQIEYDYLVDKKWKGKYLAVAPRGGSFFGGLFKEIVLNFHLPVMIIGGPGDYCGYGEDCTGLDFLETLSILHYAVGFVGLMSSQLALANAFDMPKVIPHDGRSWAMDHVIYSDSHHYLTWPSVEDVYFHLSEGRAW